MERLRILITVKTYPIPSATYDELVCTAGVTEEGNFVRLYPVPFRDLPWTKQYPKYQWIEVLAERHRGRDRRKESWRPDPDSIQFYGERIKPGRDGDWSARGRYVLKNVAQSIEALRDAQRADGTSLGILRPKLVEDLVIKEEEERTWKQSALDAIKQERLWETRGASREPVRKLPYKFRYRFRCNDDRCNGHTMMNEDWELGRLYWRHIDRGDSESGAIAGVRQRFLSEICANTNETYFFVGTVLSHGTWVVLGTFYPKLGRSGNPRQGNLELFSDRSA